MALAILKSKDETAIVFDVQPADGVVVTMVFSHDSCEGAQDAKLDELVIAELERLESIAIQYARGPRSTRERRKRTKRSGLRPRRRSPLNDD